MGLPEVLSSQGFVVLDGGPERLAIETISSPDEAVVVLHRLQA
jgi:hypothetical protein